MSSPRQQTVAKRHHVWRRGTQLLFAAFMAAMLLGLGLFLGRHFAYGDLGIKPQTYRDMSVALPVVRHQVTELERELEISRTRNEVDRAALEMVRREITVQKEQIMDLGENLGFYQNLMAPGDLARGLTLKPIELVATESEDRFAFRIVALQEARKHTLLKGSLSVEILGMIDNEERSLPLSDLSEDVDEKNVALRFRYFQAIEGELVLPSGFQPRSVSVVARASTPSRVEVRELFPWSVQ